MADWNDIEFSPRFDETKIIKKELKNFPEYCINQLTAECRKDIIVKRTPPYHCELNQIVMC